jgi:hypothetical protein
MSTKVKDNLKIALDAVADGVVKSYSKRGDNFAPTLAALYVWQETQRHAEAQFKLIWEKAVAEGVLDEDGELRKTFGKTIVCESERFTVMAEVGKPRPVFNRDAFLNAIARRFKLDRKRLDDMIKPSCRDSAAPLEKYLLEA